MNKVKAFIRLFLSVLLIAGVLFSYLSQFATPDMGLVYSVKRGKEKLVMMTKFSNNSKADYMNYLAKERLNEIKEMFDTGNLAETEIRKISLRYSTAVGEYMHFLIANNLDDKLRNLYIDIPMQQAALKQIMDTYPESFDYEKKGLIDDINYLEIYKNQIKELKGF